MGTKSLKEQMERQSQEAKQELHNAEAQKRKEIAKNLFRISGSIDAFRLEENTHSSKRNKKNT